MGYEERFALRKLTVNSVTWTDIQGLAVLPINANYVIIVNTLTPPEALLLRSDPNNANSEISIAAGASFQIGASGTPRGSLRFPQGCNAVGAVKSTSLTQAIPVESSD